MKMLNICDYYVLDQGAIDELRKAIVCWYHCESGAPAIHPSSPMKEVSAEEYAGLLSVFIQAGTMKPGHYRFANPLIGVGPYDRYSHGIPKLYFAGNQLKDEIEIDITEDHLKLLTMLSPDYRYSAGYPRFEPKRVYNGDTNAAMGAYAALRGEFEGNDEDEYPPDLGKYWGLHYEMAAVLQVFVREADVIPGVYSCHLLNGFSKLMNIGGFEAFRSLKTDMNTDGSRRQFIEFLMEKSRQKAEKRAD